MLEYIVKAPFDMKPNFSQCERPVLNADETDESIISQRVLELHRLGDSIWFETPVAKEDDLVYRATEALGLSLTCNNIKELGLAIEDDILIMHNGKLEACFVAFASSWNPSKKVGKTLSELHDPIADNETLLRASSAIMKAMCSGQSFERYTWGISSLGGYSNHPLYEKPNFNSLDDLTFRVEHERTITISEGTTAVFLIHVDIYPLKDILKTDGKLIKESIDSMSDAVLEYKNLIKIKGMMNEDKHYITN